MKIKNIQSISICPNLALKRDPHIRIIGTEANGSEYRTDIWFSGDGGRNIKGLLEKAIAGEEAKIPLINHHLCDLFLQIPPKHKADGKMALLCGSQTIEFPEKVYIRIRQELESSPNEGLEFVIFDQTENPTLEKSPQFNSPYEEYPGLAAVNSQE